MDNRKRDIRKARQAKLTSQWAAPAKQPYRRKLDPFDGHWTETRKHVSAMARQ